jgi:hypothetical protein
MSAKNRVVVNGNKQHEEIYTDATSPVSSQLQLRLFLFITAYRRYEIVQLDLTNAYLHAPMKDVVYIYIPDGFPGEGEIARLDKAAYGTKQGARRFYDFSAETLIKIGMKQCTIEPCLFRFNPSKDEECFLLQYERDKSSDKTVTTQIEQALQVQIPETKRLSRHGYRTQSIGTDYLIHEHLH